MEQAPSIKLYVPLAYFFDVTITALKDLYGDKLKALLTNNPLSYVNRRGPLQDVAEWMIDADITEYIKNTPNLIERSPRNSLAYFIPLQMLPLLERHPDLIITVEIDTNGFNLSENDKIALNLALTAELGAMMQVKLINYGEHNFSVADYVRNYTAAYLLYPYEWLERHKEELLLLSRPTCNVIFKPISYAVREHEMKEIKDQLMADPNIPIEVKENMVNVDWATLADDEFGRGTANFQTIPYPILAGIIPETEPVIHDWFHVASQQSAGQQ